MTDVPSPAKALLDTLTKETSREELLKLSYQLTAALETPRETLQRICWAQPATYAALRTGVDLKLFEVLPDPAAEGLSVQPVAAKCSAEPALISRLLKHLAATDVVNEAAPDCYTNSVFSQALSDVRFRDGVVYNYDVAYPAQVAIPTFLQATAYKDPVNPVASPFQAAHKTQDHFFGWVGARPQYLAAFGNWMAGYSAGRMNWGGFPVESKLAGVKDDEILMVDIGGGQGHDLVEFRTKYPQVTGKCVLQDQADVVAVAKTQMPKDSEAAVHDFFEEQPLKGARAYHLHSVLHDWPADDCVRILKAIKPALQDSRSRILINELVVPPKSADWRVTGMDLLMMVLGSVRERTESEFRQIVEKAGLEVIKVWYGEEGRESLIEVGLAA